MSNRGISIIGTIFTLIILGVMGASLVALVAGDQESRMKSILRERAFYAVQAGFEYALREIKEGGYPVVGNKVFGDSLITTTIDPSDRKIQVTGAAGEALRFHSITTDKLAADCIEIETAGASAGGMGGNILQGVSVSRNCLNAVRIDKITAEWVPNLGERITRISVGGTESYNDPQGVGSEVPADILDYRITGSATIDAIEFSSSIAGKQITLTLTFTDSSAKASDPMNF